MAFKSFSQFQEDKNGDFFVLPNDGDFADVVFLYTSPNDVLVADVHYLNTAVHKGYVHCCEQGCPACAYVGQNGGRIQLQHKIFIPLYNIQKNKIEFWDRTTFFEQQLQKQVFNPFPNPSEAVFRITRNGEAGSRDTTYSMMPVGRNSAMPYEKILADFGVKFPDVYDKIVREMSVSEMSAALNNTGAPSNLEDYGYVPVPRGAATMQDYQPSPALDIPTTTYSAPPEVAPPLADYVPGAPVEATSDTVEDAPADDSEDSLDDVNF